MQSEVTRREALVGGVAGLAALSLSPAAGTASSARPQDSKPPLQKGIYTARDFSGLLGTPGFSNPMLENHFTLYKGYVTNTNSLALALSGMASSESLSLPQAAELRRRFGWEFNGMRLHELYFENFGGKEPFTKDSKAGQKITAAFGNYEAWEKEFRALGAMRGIGWVALMQDPWSNHLFNIWINEHDVGVLAACPIIVIMDVFEHAYMTDYGIKRAPYIDAFMKSINWANVEKRV